MARKVIYRIKTAELIDLNIISVLKDYNKSIPEEIIDNLDTSGWNVLRVLMNHEHRHGVKCETHLRCMVWMKVVGQMEPAISLIDIPMGIIDEYAEDITKEEVIILSKLGGAIDE